MAIIGSPPTLDLEVCAVTSTAAKGITSSIPEGTACASAAVSSRTDLKPRDVQQEAAMAELVADSQDGIAVNAHSTNNHSLFSRSETSNGVIGHSNGDAGGGNAGVFGEHLNNGTGVTGKSQGGFGVAGLSQGNSGVFPDSENGFGVQAHSVNSHRLVSRSETSNEPGTVVVLAASDGTSCESERPYDRRVAGVVSGAEAFKPGIVLDARASGSVRIPVALVGKVYCKVDASYGRGSRQFHRAAK